MNQQIRELFRSAEGRYYNQSEQADLEAYAEGLLARLETMRAIERAEGVILDEVVRVVMRSHEVIARDHGTDAVLRVRRDQALVLRYASMAMLMHDKSFIYDKLAVWLRTILCALCRPEQVIFGYRALIDACRASLTESDAEAIVPYIDVMIKEFESQGAQSS